VSLCDRFPSLSPFSVRAERWHDVLLIYSRIIKKIPAEKRMNGAFERNGVIWKPATSDDWW
jgi:hypothetical protein